MSRVAWYIDATKSMQGFVAGSAGSEYLELLRALERNLTTAWPSAKVEVHGFRGSVSAANRLRDAFSAAFYESKDDTDLAVAGGQVDSNNLSIIVSDLYQSNDDIESFRRSLLKSGFGQKLEGTVFAVQSRFDGTIYDIDRSRRTVRSSQSRPVYAMAFGPPEALRKLTELMNKSARESRMGVLNTLALSNLAGRPRTPFSKLPFRTEANAGGEWFADVGFDEASTAVEGNAPESVRQLRTSHGKGSKSVQFSTRIVLSPGLQAATFIKPVLHVDAWDCTKRNQGFTFFPSKRGGACADIDCRKIDEPTGTLVTRATVSARPAPIPAGVDQPQEIGIEARLDFRPLTAAGHTYRVEVAVASQQGRGLPGWVDSFDQNAGFHPAKTPNLRLFLQSMIDGLRESATADRATIVIKVQ